MYTGENQIAIASQHHIAEVFLQMLEEKTFSQISIRDLCKEAVVSRQTFYSLFETKENIIVFVLERHFTFSLNHIFMDNEKLDVYDICQAFGEYIFDSKVFLRKVVDCKLAHLVNESLYHAIFECKRYRIRVGDAKDANDLTMRKYHAAFLSGSLSSILQIYLEDTNEMDARDVTKLCYRLLSGKEL